MSEYVAIESGHFTKGASPMSATESGMVMHPFKVPFRVRAERPPPQHRRQQDLARLRADLVVNLSYMNDDHDLEYINRETRSAVQVCS